MNKKIKRMVQWSLLCFGGLTFTLQAADGTLKTKVKFIQFTCNLTTDSKNMSVPLGDVNRSQLAKIGQMSPQVFFEVKATGCPIQTSGGTYVTLTFSGTAPLEDAKAFALDKDAIASGVAVKIASNNYGNSYVFFAPNYGWGTAGIPNSDGEITLKYAAQYVALNDNVTPGTANLTTQINLRYH
ncbi:fimbrial protein [Serratia nematodiphila]|nr:fimbrial protein [Serratia marcescens]PIN53588.1 hypothetical protein CUB91_21295 [Serratia marcescens]